MITLKITQKIPPVPYIYMGNMNCTGIVMKTFYQSLPDKMTIPGDLLIMMNLYNHRGMVISIQQ